MLLWVMIGFVCTATVFYFVGAKMGERNERVQWYAFLSTPDAIGDWETTDFQRFALAVLMGGWPNILDEDDEDL